MAKREQLTHERLDALLDVLEKAGVIDEQLNKELSATRELGEARELPEQASVNAETAPGRVEGGK